MSRIFGPMDEEVTEKNYLSGILWPADDSTDQIPTFLCYKLCLITFFVISRAAVVLKTSSNTYQRTPPTSLRAGTERATPRRRSCKFKL